MSAYILSLIDVNSRQAYLGCKIFTASFQLTSQIQQSNLKCLQKLAMELSALLNLWKQLNWSTKCFEAVS